MEIGLTDEVRKMCGLRPLSAPGEGSDPFFCWDMARVDLGSRKLLIMSNTATSACAVTRMTAADWKHIDEVAHRLIEDAVGCCGCSPEEYFSLAGETALTKTHGRRAVGNMLTLAHALWADEIDMSEKLQWRQMVFLNHRFISRCVAHDGYGYPAERFAEDLAARLAARS